MRPTFRRITLLLGASNNVHACTRAVALPAADCCTTTTSCCCCPRRLGVRVRLPFVDIRRKHLPLYRPQLLRRTTLDRGWTHVCWRSSCRCDAPALLCAATPGRDSSALAGYRQAALPLLTQLKAALGAVVAPVAAAVVGEAAVGHPAMWCGQQHRQRRQQQHPHHHRQQRHHLQQPHTALTQRMLHRCHQATRLARQQGLALMPVFTRNQTARNMLEQRRVAALPLLRAPAAAAAAALSAAPSAAMLAQCHHCSRPPLRRQLCPLPP